MSELQPSYLQDAVVEQAQERSRLQKILALGATVLMTLGLGMTTDSPQPAEATTEGLFVDTYPDKNAVSYNGDWWVDENRDGKVQDNGELISPRLYYYKNCTDWAAWRAMELTGVGMPGNLGHANTWDDNAPKHGFAVDNTPEPGDIAVWDKVSSTDTYGHVAVVEEVNADGSVNISEYNYGSKGSWHKRTGVRAHHYIDVNGTGKGINGQPINGGSSGIPHGPTTLGVYNPDNSVFYLRDSNDAGPAGVAFQYGNANWIPIAGDWDGNGTVTAGLYDPITSTFHLRNSHTSGSADRTFQYGNIGWKPIAGDWDGNGYWSVGLYNPADSTFYLKNFNGAGAADYTFSFGNSGWEPIAGDWDGRDDGNSASTIGVYDPTGATFYLNNENNSSAADRTIQYGNIGWKPIAGDWDGNGFSSIGAYNPNSATFYLRNANSAGPADITVQYGNIGWKPVVGDWNAG